MSGRLRVGVLLEAGALRAWQSTLIERIRNSDCAELALILTCRGLDDAADIEPRVRRPTLLPARAAALLDRASRRLERGIECDRDAFALREEADVLAGLPTFEVSAEARRTLACTPELLARVRAFDLDAIVALGACAPSAALRACATYGVWRLDSAEYPRQAGAPPGFWEVYYGHPVTRIALTASCADGEERRLAQVATGTRLLSVKQNRSNAYWTALSLVPRTLARLHQSGPDALFRRRPCKRAALVPQCLQSAPDAAAIATYMLRNVRRRALERMKRTFGVEQWILLVYFGAALSTRVRDFRRIVPPSDRYWADPHIVHRGDRYYVYVEEYLFATGRGHISVIELDAQGRLGPPMKVLERPYHLSYPCVFEHAGELYMVPESMENRTVSLYRCAEFPGRWEFVGNLLDNVSAVDSTLLHHAGKWWLFTSIVENEGGSASEELFLFHADSLLGGTWTPHARNPIVSDATRARGAGAIQQRAGKLYRPSQDCAVRYGYAIRINEISTLSAEEYAETEVACISPDWDRRILGTHTLAHAPGLTVVDALLLQSKLGEHRSS